MKPRQIILTSSASTSKADNQSSTSGKDKSEARKKIIALANTSHPAVLFLLAIILAIGIRLVAGFLLAGTSLGFVWQELFKTFFVILILAAYAVLSVKGGAIGISVIILAILLAISNIARYDYSDGRLVSADDQGSQNNLEQRQSIDPDQSKIDFLRLGPGTHVFELEAGEETPWRGSPNGRTNACGYSSESYDYTIIFSDGTSYPGGSYTRIPEKNNVFWKVRAHSKQRVYVTIL